jgi:DNA mismatch repair protein MSH6
VKEYVECEERIFQSKESLLKRSVQSLLPHANDFHRVNDVLSKLDCFISFSTYSKVVPNLSLPMFGEELDIEGARNPIYFNNTENDLNFDGHKILLLTGPNMGGKSTLLRSVCLNIILSQIGMKVPCKRMNTRIFDRIFTRIGASDSLERGESTFMVELAETSKILNESTKDSFIVIDELGRGTSTKDGESIARAVLEFLKERGVYVLFSTHYHGMVEAVDVVKKGYMNSVICGEDVVFLYKMVGGVCNDSHGISVAKMAGVPDTVISIGNKGDQKQRAGVKSPVNYPLTYRLNSSGMGIIMCAMSQYGVVASSCKRCLKVLEMTRTIETYARSWALAVRFKATRNNGGRYMGI